MSPILINVIIAVAFFVFGFFFSRANGAGTDAEKVAKKVDAIWDELEAKIKKEIAELKAKNNLK